jgi:4-hydroxybenzoate polyprenyltransferase
MRVHELTSHRARGHPVVKSRTAPRFSALLAPSPALALVEPAKIPGRDTVQGYLVVDLDDTLIRSDMLYETFWECVSSDAFALIGALPDLASGRARFKARLSRLAPVKPEALPYNDDVLDYIRAWRERGGKVALVTASDQSSADAIADHLGVFDEVVGSDGVRNLKGEHKAAFLVGRYGGGNFDYIGDALADLPVWARARKAITVGMPERHRSKVRSEGGGVQHLSEPEKGWAPYARAMRPHQWLKNALIFLPVLAAHEASPWIWMDALLAFICFSLVASSVYLLNDLLDLSADRAHPRKRMRPLASGTIPLRHGTLMVPGLLLGGLAFALFIERWEFFGVLTLYYAVTLAYSMSLKRRPIIDICTLAGLYTLRIFAGAAATGIPISKWLLAFSIFFFLSLAAVKRQGELVDAIRSQRDRAVGRGYLGSDMSLISMMAVASGYVAVLIMALYFDSPNVRALYPHPDYLWGLCPILLYWVSRMVMMAHRGVMDDDPIVFSVKDRTSRYCAVLVSLVVAAGMT